MKDLKLSDDKYRNNEIDEIKPDSLLFENEKIEIFSREVMNSSPGCYFKIRKHTIEDTSFYPFLYFDLQTAKNSEQYYSFKDIIESTFNRYTKKLQSFEEIELANLVNRINDQLSDSINGQSCIDYLIGLLFPENGILLYITSRQFYSDNFKKNTSVKALSCGYPALGDCTNYWKENHLIMNSLPTQIKYLKKDDFLFFENDYFTLGSFREDKTPIKDSVYYINYINYISKTLTAIKKRSKVILDRENVPEQYQHLEFDFSKCKSTAAETCNIFLAIEQILRLYPATRKGYSKSVLLSKKTNLDLKKYFVQYDQYFSSGLDFPENEKFLVFNNLYEQEPVGSSFLFALRQKTDAVAIENTGLKNLITNIEKNRKEELNNYLERVEEFNDIEELEELEVVAEEDIIEVEYIEEETITTIPRGAADINLLNDLFFEEKIEVLEDLEELEEPEEEFHYEEIKIIEDFGVLEELDTQEQ